MEVGRDGVGRLKIRDRSLPPLLTAPLAISRHVLTCAICLSVWLCRPLSHRRALNNVELETRPFYAQNTFARTRTQLRKLTSSKR